MKFDKKLVSIIGICFIAEPFFIHLQNLVLFVVSKLLHVKCFFNCFGFGTLCKAGNDPGLTMILLMSTTFIVFAFSLIGFILSKRGAINKSIFLTLSGALLFYSALHQTLLFLLMNIRYNFLQNLFYEDSSDIRPLAYFGNYHNYELAFFILNISFILIYIYMAYQIIFKMWEREFRIKLFTAGVLSCLAGNIFWYFFFGKFIYHFFGGGFYS